MLVDTRKKDEQQLKQGFNPNVVNEERVPQITTGSKVGYIFL
jgi:hypothetical protein